MRRSGALLLAAALLAGGCGNGVQRVSEGDAGAHEVSMARYGSGYALAWYDNRDGNAEIYMRLLDGRGRPAGDEHRLTRDPELSYEPDIAVLDERVVVAWYAKRANGSVQPLLAAFGPEGNEQWRVAIASQGRNPVVRVSGRGIFVAWIQDESDTRANVWAGWWSTDGVPLYEPRILAPAGRTTWNLNAAFDEGGTPWVVFDARADTRSEELFAVRGTEPPLRLTADDGVASKYPDIAFSGGRAAITWFDERDGNKEVYVGVTPASGVARLEQVATRVTTTPGESIGAYLAWNGTTVGVAWSDDTAGQNEIYLQRFDAEGTPLGAAQQVTETPTESNIPAIVPAAQGFALAWSEYEPAGDGHSVEAKSEIAFTIHP